MTRPDVNRHFSIDEGTGNLVILRRLSVTESYLLNISVVDKGGLTAHTSILCTVEDVNDHSPVFAKDHYEFRYITLSRNIFCNRNVLF